MLHRRLLVLAALALLVVSLWNRNATAQSLPGIDLEQARAGARDGAAPETFGSSTTVLTLQYSAFESPYPEHAANLLTISYRRACTSLQCLLEAPVILPNGALIDSIEMEGCDNSDSPVLIGFLNYLPLNTDSGFIPLGATILTTGAPGCATFSSNLTPSLLVDNAANSYVFTASLEGGLDVRFRAVRIRYHLQVSAAPAVATFPVDVPTTHPFFRFVEALAAAGITSGCGPLSYCPDMPVTRGQMAVFLAAALGLHFPN